MTHLLSLDPGKNSGAALGHYDDSTPYTLVDRWQIHGGVDGFKRWWRQGHWKRVDDLVVEKFILASDNEFTADLTPVEIQGALSVLLDDSHLRPIWQPRTDKSRLVGYPKSAVTKAQRQRVRFDFLKEHGLFVPGTENDDSHDAICHALVRLKGIKHRPTLMHYWKPRRDLGDIAA
jgi:hypothetical protein